MSDFNDDAEMAALQAAANRTGPGYGGAASDEMSEEDKAFLQAPFNPEFEGFEYKGVKPEGYYLCKINKLTPKISQQRQDVMTGETAGGNRYVQLDLLVVAGDFKNTVIFDRVMLEGKGMQRFHVLVSALNLYDKERKRYTGGTLAALLNKYLWVKVIHRTEEYPVGSGERKLRDRVDFGGFEPITAHPLPALAPEHIAAITAQVNAQAQGAQGAPPPQQPQQQAAPQPPPQAPPQPQPQPQPQAQQPPLQQQPVSTGGQTAMPPW